jgi:hypothetical protein
MAFQCRLSKRLNEAISYHLVCAHIFDIDSPMLFEITDMMIGNINML